MKDKTRTLVYLIGVPVRKWLAKEHVSNRLRRVLLELLMLKL